MSKILPIPQYRIIILGAGRGTQGSLPSAVTVTDGERRVLDWLLSAFSKLNDKRICFVGGYLSERVIEKYADISFYINHSWDSTGPAASLALVPLTSQKATYVCYSDIIFRSSIVTEMEEADADLGILIDTKWRTRYSGRGLADLSTAEKVRLNNESVQEVGEWVALGDADAEFAGVVRLSPTAASKMQNLFDSGNFRSSDTIPTLIQKLISEDVKNKAVDTCGEWAELDAPQDLARFVLGTKAESLERLRPLLRHGHIGESISFTRQSWMENRRHLLKQIGQQFEGTRVIIRSSACTEDGWDKSSAGENLSVPDIDSGSSELELAIHEVFASYKTSSSRDQVLIQEQLKAVSLSGVVLTRTPTQRAPYYIINFDSETGRTDTVTSGQEHTRTLFIHRDSTPSGVLSPILQKVLVAVKEIEMLVGHDCLDIEFAVIPEQEQSVHILQVRPLVVSQATSRVDDNIISQAIQKSQEWFTNAQMPQPFLLGDRTQLSVMSDWNPAEIIGTKPDSLSHSLYRFVITDETWATQRAQYGYRDVRPCPLLVDLVGHPYIDVRATFNSFIPASLSEFLAKNLMNYYLSRLEQNPHLHDKVEFEILFTCLAFDFGDRSKILQLEGFTQNDINELRIALQDLTRNGIRRCLQDFKEISILEKRYRKIKVASLESIDEAFYLLDDVKRLGALNFAHLARGGFVAVNLLRSLEAIGITSKNDTDAYIASVTTVSSDFQRDAFAVKEGQKTFSDFLDRYGHLRPGTYDITSPRYSSDPERYITPIILTSCAENKQIQHPWSESVRNTIQKKIGELGLDVSINQFDEFLRTAIQGRELSKFVFTRNLSDALECFADIGKKYGLTREEIKHLTVSDWFELRKVRSDSRAERLRRLVREGKERTLVTQGLSFPAHLVSADQFCCFEQMRSVPNFVTQKKISAPVALLGSHSDGEIDVRGKIVMIPSADPGYDWIFSASIAGLVTMYGGSNSHLAIRAAEFGVPAAIGVGDNFFDRICRAAILELDCAARRIQPISLTQSEEKLEPMAA